MKRSCSCDAWQKLKPEQLSFFRVKPPSDAAELEALRARLIRRHTQLDMDPLDNSAQQAWWLLYPGDHAELHFSGTRLGILTMIGKNTI